MKNILITGATGSFGSIFIKNLMIFNLAERICVYSRGEHRQADLRRELHDDPRLRWFIGDVRDKARLRRAMEGIDVVVHAAALKRIETVHYNILEAVQTNIIGTSNVVECAIDAGVDKAVLNSSDKACEPTTAYGYTKAVAEAIFQNAGAYAGRGKPYPRGTRFAITRYGNIAGSQGSVIPIWREMQANGFEVVPISDPDCTRFWMTQGEAATLVLHAIEHTQGGDLFVPNLPAYRLGDLAEAMKVNTRIIGLGNGEKLHESMRPGEPSDKARR